MIASLLSTAVVGFLMVTPSQVTDSQAPEFVLPPAVSADVINALADLPTNVVTIPNTIPSDCSIDVTRALSQWIASVPNSTTLRFAADGCYRVDYTIYMNDRHDIALDGRGASFESSMTFPEYPNSRHHMINMLGGSDIVLLDLVLKGTNPEPIFNRNRVWYHGINVEGVDGLLMDGIHASNFWGDFLHIAEDGRGPGAEKHAVDIVLRNSSSNIVGRSQISCTACEHVLVTDSTFNDTGYQVFNIEVGYAAWHASDVAFTNNLIGGFVHLSVFVNAGKGEYVRNVTFIGNEMTSDPVSCQAPVYVLDTDPAKSNFVFRDNTLRALGAGFRVGGITGVTIEDNYVQLLRGGMCKEPGTAVRIKSSTGTIQQNHFPNYSRVIEPTSAASAQAVCGNRLNGTEYDQPVAC